MSIAPGERYKESISDDKKFNVTTDNKANVSFMILTNSSFPERYSYKLLIELENKSISTINKHYINKVVLDVTLIKALFVFSSLDIVEVSFICITSVSVKVNKSIIDFIIDAIIVEIIIEDR